MNRMNRTMARALALTTALALTLTARAAGEEQTGGLPGEWLSHYTGARTLGLGGAFVGAADDALGILWNPAGLQFMDQGQLMFENVRLFEDTSMNSFGVAVPGSWLPSFGIGVVSLGSGEFQRTNEMNDVLGTFREAETAYFVTLAQDFSPRIAVGANLKLVRQTVEDLSGGGFGVDAGALFQVTPQLRLGASVLNLGGPSIRLRDVAETYPLEFRGGFAASVLGGHGLIAAQVDAAEGLGVRLRGGAEYWIQSGMALRVGYDGSGGTGGCSYRFAPQYQVDYGVADHALGMTHRVGLSYRFGGFFASNRAEPTVFSPTGERAVTKISLNARTKSEPASWTLDLVDKSGQVVRRFGGEGQPPPHLMWDGKDDAGLPMADGNYRYQLTVRDHDGRVLLAPVQAVQISTGGPQGSVPLLATP